jgi:hypothetical protein
MDCNLKENIKRNKMMPHKLKLLALVFSIISYSSSVYSVDTTLEQSTDNSFAPGGSTNDVSLAQSDLFQMLANFENVTSLGDLFNLLAFMEKLGEVGLDADFLFMEDEGVAGINKMKPNRNENIARLSDLFDINEYSSADHHGEGTAKPVQTRSRSPWDNIFLFSSGGYRNQELDSVGETSGSETESFHGNFGIAAMFTKEIMAGVSLTIQNSDTEADERIFNEAVNTGKFVPFELDADSTTVSLFTSFNSSKGYRLTGTYSYTDTSTDMIRRTAFDDIGGGGNLFVLARADDVDSDIHNFSLNGGYTFFEESGWMWGPKVSLSYGFGESDAYTETGGGTNVNMSVGESEYTFWTVSAGVHASKHFKLYDNAKQKTHASFGVDYVRVDNRTDNDVLITQVDTNVSITRPAGTDSINKPGDDFLRLALGLNHNVTDNARLGFNHSMELLRDHSFAYSLGLNFAYTWN